MANKKEEQLPISDTGWTEPEEAAPTDDWNSVEPEDWNTVETVTVELQVVKHSGKFNLDHTKYLFFGESGTGKTRLAASFPNVVFADIDHGLSSVDWEVASVDISDEFDAQGNIRLHAFEKLDHMYRWLKAGNHEFETVVIDTLNEMQRIAMRATVEEFPAIRRSYENLPSMSDYGKMLHDMHNLTIKFIELPMRVVLLAQVGDIQFETDMLQPQLIGKNTSRIITRKMDVIGYIQTSVNEDPDTHMRYPQVTFNSPTAVVKDRSFKLPAIMVNPTYAQIAKALSKTK